jgi:hypothetical protein
MNHSSDEENDVASSPRQHRHRHSTWSESAAAAPERTVAVSFMKKDVGKVIIKALFKMELNIELSARASTTKSFFHWKLSTALRREREGGSDPNADVEAAAAAAVAASAEIEEKNRDTQSRGASIGSAAAAAHDAHSGGGGTTAPPPIAMTPFEAAMASLRAAYAKLTSHTGQVRNNLATLRQTEVRGEGFVSAGNESKVLVALMFLRQALIRKMRRAFDRWFFLHIRKANSVLNNKKLVTTLTLDRHKAATRLFHIDSKLQQNDTVGKAIECSHAFFRWKIAVVREILQEERENGEKDRRKLYGALRQLKAVCYDKIRKNKTTTHASRVSGSSLARKVGQLHTMLGGARTLNELINDTLVIDGAEAERVRMDQP